MRALLYPALALLLVLSSSAERPDLSPASCRAASHAAAPAVIWQVPDDAGDRKHLAAWCATVGTPVIDARLVRSAAPAGSLPSLAVVSWNMHVGGGDLPGLMTAVKRGDFTNGQAVTHFVLLLQEAYRASPAIPALRPSSPAAPSRIAPEPPGAAREDIVAIARRFGLALYYVPSMRNGSDDGGDRREDRGNAILSTWPLSSFKAIELPFARQRRVAIKATVTGHDADGNVWQLAVTSAHLDATTNWAGLRVFATGLRARQARSVADALHGERLPLVLGADLNTWWGGRREDAYKTLAGLFSEPRAATSGDQGTLDYLFFNLPSNVTTIADHFGSDHAPLLGQFKIDT